MPKGGQVSKVLLGVEIRTSSAEGMAQDQLLSLSKDEFKLPKSGEVDLNNEGDKMFCKSNLDSVSTDSKVHVCGGLDTRFSLLKPGKHVQVLTPVNELQNSYQLEELMFDPVYTEDLMWDPVKASDGYTYDRWTLIEHDDHPNGRCSLCDLTSPFTRAPLSILCDDVTVRQRLYTVEKFRNQGVERKSTEMREKYRTKTLELVKAGQYAEALERLEHVLQWAPGDDVCREHRDVIADRLGKSQSSSQLVDEFLPRRNENLPPQPQLAGLRITTVFLVLLYVGFLTRIPSREDVLLQAAEEDTISTLKEELIRLNVVAEELLDLSRRTEETFRNQQQEIIDISESRNCRLFPSTETNMLHEDTLHTTTTKAGRLPYSCSNDEESQPPVSSHQPSEISEMLEAAEF
ncbi:hypothetical protein R1sor_016415 [Riccia sorocarpa]|uniref:U-box domain-containing protein n=1 Tax=Riccia sorocarpa TaxID=122646 RepID=A0ABD3HGS6_9MARC